MQNRLPSEPAPEGTKVVLVQTPAGLIKLALPAGGTADGRDPVAVAMSTFQSAVDRGAEDPLTETLNELEELANRGVTQPLMVGLAILSHMSENGMLPPMDLILQGTGLSAGDVEHALNGRPPKRSPGILDKIDQARTGREELN